MPGTGRSSSSRDRLLIIAIAGGAVIHPIIFALAIVAIVLFFMHSRA
jgi:hypothetical protein